MNSCPLYIAPAYLLLDAGGLIQTGEYDLPKHVLSVSQLHAPYIFLLSNPVLAPQQDLEVHASDISLSIQYDICNRRLYGSFFDNFALCKYIKLKSSPKGEGFTPERYISGTLLQCSKRKHSNIFWGSKAKIARIKPTIPEPATTPYQTYRK
jgi:hypothetical protein